MTNAEQTLRIWRDQYLWHKRIAAGEDPHEVSADLRNEWGMHDQMMKPLPISEIVAAFGEDCIPLCRRHIRNLTRQINPYFDAVRHVKSMPDEGDWPQGNEIIRIWFLQNYQFPQVGWQMRHRARLRNILALALVSVKKEGTDGQEEDDRVTQADVERARAVGIDGLHTFERSKRIGHRFMACCPFHSEKSASFFIFRDNKFRCFGCGEHGDAIDFWMKIAGVEFIDAVKYLKGRI